MMASVCMAFVHVYEMMPIMTPASVCALCTRYMYAKIL